MTTSADERAMLAAVCADPGDDTVRLAYADWLDERGQPGDADRAEFIRVQVELARLGGCDPVCSHEFGHRDDCRLGFRAGRLHNRERQLLNDPHPVGNFRIYPNRMGWSEDLRQWANVEFRRGFVEAVTCAVDDWWEHRDGLRRRHPVTTVRLRSAYQMGTFQTRDGHLVDVHNLDEFLAFLLADDRGVSFELTPAATA